jgi:hypothetical protein
VTSPAPSPERYRHAVIAHIMLDDASAAIEFYQRALSATELFRIAGPHGRILHAEISVGGAVVMPGPSAGSSWHTSLAASDMLSTARPVHVSGAKSDHRSGYHRRPAARRTHQTP